MGHPVLYPAGLVGLVEQAPMLCLSLWGFHTWPPGLRLTGSPTRSQRAAPTPQLLRLWSLHGTKQDSDVLSTHHVLTQQGRGAPAPGGARGRLAGEMAGAGGRNRSPDSGQEGQSP